MRREYFIGLDTHGSFCEMAAITQTGNLVARGSCDTTIPALRELLAKVPTPRHLVFEEGPLANWLFRNLVEDVKTLTVAQPRRNRLIACDGDKDDPVDAEKLANLLRGGYITGTCAANDRVLVHAAEHRSASHMKEPRS